MYVYLSSEVTNGYHSSNTSTDFVVTLPTSYYFGRNEKWEIGLVDIYMEFDNGSVTLDEEIQKRIIHVYSDCIESSIFNGSERKILNHTTLKNCTRDIFSPTQVRYISLTQDRLSCIRIYIKNCDGTDLSLPAGTTRCTLHIQQV